MTSIFPSAAASQTVKQNDNEYEVVKEGLAVILKPATKDMSSNPHKKEAECESQQDSVFYNPKQQFDRDLSVLAIKD